MLFDPLQSSYQLEAAQELARRELARRHMRNFVQYTMGESYLMGWVHREICRELDEFLDAVILGKSPRLMITMPPRHGKSELATRRFPAYVFGRYPDLPIISTSYSADLSSRMSKDVQRVIDSQQYRLVFPETKLAEKKGDTATRTADFFEIVGHRGVYRSAGVGGGVTGLGMSIGIIDDAVKDRAEADSYTIREKIWDWYGSTFYTRLAPGGGILLINTRWHMDDLAGRLLEAARTGEGDQWRVVNFPAIATKDEEFRKAGEALHPERYPVEQLMAIKAALGIRDWEALYQQNPVPDGGAIFRKEWIQYWKPGDLPPKFDKLVISWDMAFKDNEDSDYVVGQVWGKYGAQYYLLDQSRGRVSFTGTVDAFKSLSDKWPTALEKLVEDKANGPAVIDSLKRHVSGIIPVNPDGSKSARAHAITPLFEAGNVFLPDVSIAPWIRDYEAELLQFPAGAHDDQVDATTQALRRIMQKPGMNFNPANLRRR